MTERKLVAFYGPTDLVLEAVIKLQERDEAALIQTTPQPKASEGPAPVAPRTVIRDGNVQKEDAVVRPDFKVKEREVSRGFKRPTKTDPTPVPTGKGKSEDIEPRFSDRCSENGKKLYRFLAERREASYDDAMAHMGYRSLQALAGAITQLRRYIDPRVQIDPANKKVRLAIAA
jgi:hypothetical protein